GNCLPSLHAANCLLFMHFNRTRPAPRLHGALAAAIIASTLLVKQHYAVDLVAGGLVYAATATFLRSIEIVGVESPEREAGTLLPVAQHGSCER
ncbi:MAG: phosphatase PAP2 family protein, partial [Deltaproteobacteria bacterium]|nr:phosphatase PAP2 family protein [Deltaproteobacteria bacterium]